MSEKIRIGYLLHGDRNIGGGERVLFQTVTGLNRKQFEPVVFYAKSNSLTEELKQKGIETIPIEISPVITSIYRDAISFHPIRWITYFYHILQAAAAVTRALKQYHIALLQPHDNLSKIIGGLAAKYVDTPLVSWNYDTLNGSLTDRLLGLYQITFMDRIISICNCSKNSLPFGRKNKKVTTVYNGTDTALFDPSRTFSLTRNNVGITDPEVLLLGIISVLDPFKGHRHLFQALKDLKDQGLNRFVCLVIGHGREEKALQRLSEELGLNDVVKFLGFRQDIPELLNLLDILVLPSEREGLPCVVIEAMAMGVPVIATAVGGIPEAIVHGKTGLIIPPRDVSELTIALRSLMTNADLRYSMGIAGRKRVLEKFDLSQKIRETEGIYLELNQKTA